VGGAAPVGGPFLTAPAHSFDVMIEQLSADARAARGAAAIGAWARLENAAAARRVLAMADLLAARFSASGSAERDQWCLDNWDAVAAEVAAEQNVSPGVAANQLLVAQALREHLPRVAEVFAAGAVTYRMVATVVSRTHLVTDPETMAKIDTELAAQIGGWGSLSVAKTVAAIDYWVDQYDPGALRRTEARAREREVKIIDPGDGSGLGTVEASLFVHDTETVRRRIKAVAATVCEKDPRTTKQREADAFVAVFNDLDRLQCRCDDPDCAARANSVAASVVVHVIAHEDSLSTDTPARLDGPPPREPDPAPAPGQAKPAMLMGGAILPASLLAATLAGTAKIEYLVPPGDSPPEPHHRPSKKLATFVRCRDMTCRFPGCDEPAEFCDIDHTIPYPVGPTQAANTKCLCRKHHLLKTFWGWRDVQHPDGTVEWTSPSGQRYVTHPGCRLLFPELCVPTAPAVPAGTPEDDPARTLKMPRRKSTRAQNRARAIREERRLNDDHVAERNRPPPF